MKHEELTLTELKEWTKSARNLVEHLQDEYHSYLPTGHREAFGSITNSIYNCLDCLVEMFNNDELELVEYTIDPKETMIDDNQADEMAQYNELMKEVGDSDKEAREIAYDDTIHEYINKRTEQLKEQVDVDNEYQGLEYYNTNLNKED